MANYTQANNSYMIDYPFSFNQQGRVSTITETNTKMWKNKILSLVSTGALERIWYSDYGIDLSSLLFEPSQSIIEEAIRAINELFISWLPELELNDVQPSYDVTGGYLVINVNYSLPSGKQDSVKIDTSSLSLAGEKIEGM